MSSIVPINPKPFVTGLVGSKILVRLKWGETAYQGDLVAVDGYMNLQLRNTEEYVAGKSTGVLGEILIRCNNVLYISKAGNAENGNDVDMSE